MNAPVTRRSATRSSSAPEAPATAQVGNFDTTFRLSGRERGVSRLPIYQGFERVRIATSGKPALRLKLRELP